MEYNIEITAKTVTEFEALNSAINALPEEIKETVKSVKNNELLSIHSGSVSPVFILKKSYSKPEKILVTDDIEEVQFSDIGIRVVCKSSTFEYYATVESFILLTKNK